jgi:hypothetical protein
MMSKFRRRLWDSFLPGLIALEPMGAMAYYQTLEKMDPSPSGSARARGLELVSDGRGKAVIVADDVPRILPAAH